MVVMFLTRVAELHSVWFFPPLWPNKVKYTRSKLFGGTISDVRSTDNGECIYIYVKKFRLISYCLRILAECLLVIFAT